jgi:hypothetical protein
LKDPHMIFISGIKVARYMNPENIRTSRSITSSEK